MLLFIKIFHYLNCDVSKTISLFVFIFINKTILYFGDAVSVSYLQFILKYHVSVSPIHTFHCIGIADTHFSLYRYR